jgi:hypothetical protein
MCSGQKPPDASGGSDYRLVLKNRGGGGWMARQNSLRILN